MKNLIFTLIILICLSFSSNAQITTIDGYYISNTYDTVHCKLEYSKAGFNNKKTFLSSCSSKIMFLKPNNCKGFFISPNISFETKLFNGEKLFFKILSKGEINLYTNGRDLFVSKKYDSLIMLNGGKKIVSISGKSYSKKIETYKYQIKNYLSDSTYFKKIDNLYFDKKPITKLIKQINKGDEALIEHKEFEKKYHKNYLNIGVSFSLNFITFTGYKYSNDSLLIDSDLFHPETKIDYNEPHTINSLGIGIKYGRKIGITNTYITFGLEFERLFNTQPERIGSLHSSFIISPNGEHYYSDTIGKVVDSYNFKMNYITLPITIHQEITYNKLRPFIEFGFTNRFLINNGTSIGRTVIINDQVTIDNIELEIPSFMMGLNFGIGVRHLFNKNNSMTYGFGTDLSMNKNESNLKSFNTTKFYITYNF